MLITQGKQKQKHGNVEVHSFHIHGVWPKKYLIQPEKKSALLNRARSQLRAVPYPV